MFNICLLCIFFSPGPLSIVSTDELKKTTERMAKLPVRCDRDSRTIPESWLASLL